MFHPRGRIVKIVYFGIHPVLKMSGDGSAKPRMSKQGRKEPRQILYMVALAAVQKNTLIKQIYQKRLQVVGNQSVGKYIGAKVFGQYSAISGHPSDFGVRVSGNSAKVLRINQHDFSAWFNENTDAAKAVSANLVRAVEDLNETESRLISEHKVMDELISRVRFMDKQLRAVLMSSNGKEHAPIQKRFLISHLNMDLLNNSDTISKQELEQYYLIIDEDYELRLRSEDGNVFKMTLKDRSKGEVTIAVEQTLYEEMRGFQIGRSIRKTRYRVADGQFKGWSVDVYSEDSSFRGMVIAEIEVKDSKTAVQENPEWLEIHTDISDLREFENRSLALHGQPDLVFFTRW